MSQLQDWPDPMVRLRATPLIADLKDLDLHPAPATRVAARHTAQRLKSTMGTRSTNGA